METKYRILQELKKRKGAFVSGEKLGQLLNISRAAVWKYINELRKEGYDIDSSSRKGYKYVSSGDIINGYEIKESLNTRRIGKKVYFYESVDSTNNVAKRLATESNEEGVLVVADTQLSGRGRMGRKWISPSGSGIWMSVVLKPQISPEGAQLFTLAASIAVSKAIESVTGLKPRIKWPNDVILSGRKVCGILTEMSAETDKVNYVVIGIGINFTQTSDDFPAEIRSTAISILGALAERENRQRVLRIDIIRETLSNLEQFYHMIEEERQKDIIDEWKRYSLVLGKRISVTRGNREYECMAEDITTEGALVVKHDDGTAERIYSGEVSIKGIMGHN
jgi:BirA family biotin operon repressor/biotin-[acetyl-CoA-carboxylase] ligase